MKKIFLLVVLLLNVTVSFSQRNQIIAYIDMEYILENIPEYLEAQNTLNEKVITWRKKLDEQTRNIEVLKTDLANEKIILTKDLIEEKEEEISLKQEELRRLESLYFGPNGDMFSARKQLVKPIQDQVYNAIQNIAVRKQYDFVFDKSSDLVMLYSNKKYDISDLVLATIVRTKKVDDLNVQKSAKNIVPNKELNTQQKELISKKEEDAAKKAAIRKEREQALKDKREAALKLRDEKRKLLLEKKEELKKKKEGNQKSQE